VIILGIVALVFLVVCIAGFLAQRRSEVVRRCR